MTNWINRKSLTALALLLTVFATVAHAQTTVTQTTLSSALGIPTQTAPNRLVVVASATNITAPTATAPGAEIFVDKEAMCVTSVTSTNVFVTRGCDGTVAAAHGSGSIVYVGQTSGVLGSPFTSSDPPFGTCTSSSQPFSLQINTTSGMIWQCTNSQWMNVVDAYEFMPPTACNSSVSGNATGTNGFTTLGTAPSIPVVQAQTSSTGTNTHYYTCTLFPDSRLSASKGSYVVDVVFLYGVQTTALGTQAATLASGTMNGKTVFQTIGYPAAAASETATGLAEAARGDAGTLTIAPVVASFNVATTTAGEFFSAKFTPANPIGVVTDNQQLLMTVSLLNTATSATVTNSPGFYVHYRKITGF